MMWMFLAMLAQTLPAPGAAARPQLSVEPSPLTPGAQATVRVLAPAGSAVRLFTNAGEVGPVTESEPGVFTAAYRPPDDGIPRVAILWARAGQGEAGWAALPVWASAEATLRGRPRALVAMTIGARRFGPVRADAAGLATVQVIVPPGTREARSGSRTIPLQVPETVTLALAAAREAVRADSDERIEVALYATTPDGVPREGAGFVLEPERGSISAPEPVSPGEYRAVWTLPAGAAGAATLSAALADRPQLKQTVRVALGPGPAATIAFEPGAPDLVAGGPVAWIRVIARDRAGNASPQPLRFETSFGELAAEQTAPGDWSLRLRVPARFEGRKSVRLVARGELEAVLELQLVPAEPKRAEITAAASTRADGQGGVEVHLSVSDDYGNPVRSAVPVVFAEPGTLSPVAERDGAYVATYRPPLLRERGRASIVAHAGAARAEARIELLPQEHLLTLSPKLGALSNLRDLTSPVLGFEAALRTDRLGPLLELLGELSWSFSSLSKTEEISPASSLSIRSRTDYLSAAVAVGGFLPVDERTRAFLHAGPTLTRVSSLLRLGTQPGSFGATFVPGAQVSVGIERRMWWGLPFLEVRWSVSGDPAIGGVLGGAARSVAVSAGGRFGLL